MTDPDPTGELLQLAFVLPGDATLTPLAHLTPRYRASLGPLPGDDTAVAVSRPRHRVTTRLVGPELAGLLSEFRQPSRITDAVLRFSTERARNPFETLEDSLEALALFISSRVLVPEGSESAEAVAASFGPGQAVAGYEVVRPLSALSDTEVYEAITPAGAPVALKIARAGASGAVGDRLATEARLLRRLEGGRTPALIAGGEHEGRRFVVQAWCAGDSIELVADRARAGSRPHERLGALCTDLLDGYAWLHERGVLHADLHPSNLVVDDAGRVSILDLERSHLIGGPSGDPAVRAGVAHFYEPEMARALLAEQTPPPATPLGEQYALAALTYFLITGAHSAELPAESTALLRQILAAEPRPFTAHGHDPWPAVEDVLARALAKDPGDRFPTVRQFAEAFRKASTEETGSRLGCS